MASVVDICNLALSHLGQGSIASISEDTEPARLCNRHYTMARDAVLRNHPWNFASARAQLAALAQAPAFEFANAFQLPADCLRALWLYNAEGYAWKVEGRTLLCDLTTVKLQYIKQVTDTAEFDALFVLALSHYIAMQIALPLTEDAVKRKAEADAYKLALQDAREVDAQEGIPDAPENANVFVDARA